MKHEQIQPMLSEYVEGNLSAELTGEVEKHLSGCASCHSDVKLLKKALQWVHKLPRVVAPVDFSKRVKRRAIRSGLLHQRRRKRWMRQMAPFEASIIVLLATTGALVVSLLLLQNELQTVVLENPPAILLVENTNQINELSESAWKHGGLVRLFGREVPPHSQLGAPLELELYIPPKHLNDFFAFVKSVRPTLDLPSQPLQKTDDGYFRFIIQFHRPRVLLPEPKAPASSSTLPQNHLDR